MENKDVESQELPELLLWNFKTLRESKISRIIVNVKARLQFKLGITDNLVIHSDIPLILNRIDNNQCLYLFIDERQYKLEKTTQLFCGVRQYELPACDWTSIQFIQTEIESHIFVDGRLLNKNRFTLAPKHGTLSITGPVIYVNEIIIKGDNCFIHLGESVTETLSIHSNFQNTIMGITYKQIQNLNPNEGQLTSSKKGEINGPQQQQQMQSN